MNFKVSKAAASEEINEFFKNIKNQSPKSIKKIKRLAMAKNISLKEKRKLFCKKCFFPYKNPKIRIKNKTKRVVCENCDYTTRWKL